MEQQTRKSLIADRFESLYGRRPDLWARAPGRVDLMGSHTDYNMGYVMTMTIDRDTWVAASPRADHRVRVHSLNLEGGSEFSLDIIDHDRVNRWTDYIRGMAWAMQAAGYPLGGWDGLIHSTVPFGSGLSSSAAIEMAAGIIFQAAGGFQLDPVQMALMGQKAENHFVGVNSGILDQYSSAMGRPGCTLLLDCRSLTSSQVSISSNLSVVICDTRAKRSLVGSEYDDRRAQCEHGVRLLKAYYPEVQALRDLSLEQFQACAAGLPAVVARRCRFIIEENQRVLDLGKVLPEGNARSLGELFAASYAGARDLYEISAPSMEAMIGAMLSAPGVVGARQAGAGFGGCLVALVEAGGEEAFVVQVGEEYTRQTGIQPSIYPVQASAGAGLLM